ncbi:trans-aconitate 2-methyltransferase [mine drainage metagenome]|uniref:Trans-aconitate 2-methyltransferase n=1 Tax=mine drainage metagenome TaxID=410659 RepID=A0A1J5PTP2_9ZZZZ
MPDTTNPYIIDTGAGTGIALEGLLPLLPIGARIDAVDISEDMVELGRVKYPSVSWHVGSAESFLEQATGAHLVVAAQAYQWMDRPRYLRAAKACLAPFGVLAILQNNRDFASSPFLDAYESLLEEMSPNYSRHYRFFDIAEELREVFAEVHTERAPWTRRMVGTDFLKMARSSTQVQRAVEAHGISFTQRLEELIQAHQSNQEVLIPYMSELFIAGDSPLPASLMGSE